MDQIDKSRTAIIVFIAIIILIAVGGYLLVTSDKESESNKKTENYDKIKVDKNQDFVYYTDREIVSSELEIIYQKININVNSEDAKRISSEINSKVDSLKNSITKISETEIPEDKELLYNVDDIYSADLQEYNYYQYKNYLIIKVDNYTYDCFGTFGAHDIKYYILNLKNGQEISASQLKEIYNVDDEEIKNKIDNHIYEINKETNNNVINVSETIANADNNYVLYISQNGDLMANIVVITNEINYNEDIVIN